jgi:hypothetical protein
MPAGTELAAVMVTPGKLNLARLSQVCGSAKAAALKINESNGEIKRRGMNGKASLIEC